MIAPDPGDVLFLAVGSALEVFRVRAHAMFLSNLGLWATKTPPVNNSDAANRGGV